MRPPGAGRKPDLRRLPLEVSALFTAGAMARPWPAARLRDGRCDLPALVADLTYAGCRRRCPHRRPQERCHGPGPAAGLRDGGVLKAGRRAPPNSDRLQRLCSPAHERGHDRDGRLCGVGQCDILELVANQAAHRSPPLAATCVADGRGSPVAGDRRRQPVRPPGARRRPDPIAAHCRRRLGSLASGERGQCRGPHVAGIGGRSSANATGALEVGHRAQFKSCAWRQAVRRGRPEGAPPCTASRPCMAAGAGAAGALEAGGRARPAGRAWQQVPSLQTCSVAWSWTERSSVRPPCAGRRPDLRRLPLEVSAPFTPGAMAQPWPAAGLSMVGATSLRWPQT